VVFKFIINFHDYFTPQDENIQENKANKWINCNRTIKDQVRAGVRE
jgi:hypothetical protein